MKRACEEGGEGGGGGDGGAPKRETMMMPPTAKAEPAAAAAAASSDSAPPRQKCPYLDTVNRAYLDFDFEKVRPREAWWSLGFLVLAGGSIVWQATNNPQPHPTPPTHNPPNRCAACR